MTTTTTDAHAGTVNNILNLYGFASKKVLTLKGSMVVTNTMEKDTADICFVNYGVTFNMLSPVHVWGSNAHPIFKKLADKTTAPKWNFYKYLVSADGKTVKHFNSKVTPDSEVFVNAVNAIL